MSGKPAQRDFTIYAGTLFTKRYIFYSLDKTTGVKTPVNLTTFTGRLVIKTAPDAPAAAYEFSTSDGSMVFGGVAGTIDLLKTPAQTSNIAFDEGSFVLYLIDASNRPLPPILIGTAYISPSTLPSGG